MNNTAPFVGPQPFGSENTIYGRDTEISELRYFLGAKRIVLLHSPSGAGKSSLLWAKNGLLNKLRKSGRFDVWGPARVNQSPGSLTVDNRFTWSAINDFEKSRKEGVRPASDFAQVRLFSYLNERNSSKSPLLVFDQFEEVLRIDAARSQPKREFFEQLGEALFDPSVWALFVIREDYLTALGAYSRMIPTHFLNQYRVDFLRRDDQAAEAVHGPLESFGRHFEEGVVDKVLENLATLRVLEGDRYVSYTADFVEPLQLQLVCGDLWSRIRDRDRSIAIRAEDFGDLNQALSNYYDAKVQRDDQQLERQIREWFDKKLITPDRVRSLVRREPKETAGLDNTVIDELVSSSYLVRQELRTGVMWFELAHDRLVEPVRRSNQEWFQEEITELQRAAGVWDARGRQNSLLLVGRALREAKAEINQKSIKLGKVDEDFLKGCDEAQEAIEARKKLRELRNGGIAVTLWPVSAMIFNWLFTALLTNSVVEDGKAVTQFSLWSLLFWLLFHLFAFLILIRYLFRRYRSWRAVGSE